MRAFLVVLLLAVPVASGAAFFTFSTPTEAALACGSDACFRLLPGESTVHVVGGAHYAFLGLDGEPLETGPLCAPAMLAVPEGANLLVVTPGSCER